MTKKIYFENLDGIRFLCFLSVFFYHSFHTEFAHIKSSDLYHFITRDIFGNGNLGVNFFFVLSGFLITFLLIDEQNTNGRIGVKDFWIRRVLRIWPLFYLCVFIGFFIFPLLKTAFGQEPNETASIAYYLTFTNNFDLIKNGLPDASILGVLWSVAIEEQFYLIWPIILFFLPVKKYWIAFSSVLIISLIYRATNNNYMVHEFHTLSCIGDMAMGALGAWLIQTNKNFKYKIQKLNPIYISLIYTSFFTVFIFRDEILENKILFISVFERAVISIIFILIILEQCFSERSLFKMGKLKFFTKMGKITYGLYCWHFVGILIVTTLTKKYALNTQMWQVSILETTLALALTIVISQISYRFFEKPFLKLKEKFAYTKLKS